MTCESAEEVLRSEQSQRASSGTEADNLRRVQALHALLYKADLMSGLSIYTTGLGAHGLYAQLDAPAGICANLYLMYSPGTGGSTTLELVRNDVSGSSRVQAAVEEEFPERSADKTLSEMVAGLRDAFGLSVADTARILMVERPTVYSWLRGDVKPTDLHLERIVRIHNIAACWRDLSDGIPYPDIKVPGVTESKSLFDLLCDERTRDFVIKRDLQMRARQMRHAGQSMKPSIRERAEARGIVASDDSDLVRLMAGRRVTYDE